MNDADIIRSLETLNAKALALRSSAEYATGVRKGNLDRLLADKSPAGVRNAFREFRTFLAFSKAPRHPETPNLTPEQWRASLIPGNPTRRVVVYSCIVGDYDTPLPPLYTAPHISYVLFRDTQLDQTVDGWKARPIPQEILALGDRTTANRYIKFHPHKLFAADFDASIYIDGNIQPVSDLSYYADLIRPEAGLALHAHRVRRTIEEDVIACKALGKGSLTAMELQVERYVESGYPLEWGLLECNVIATDLASETSRAVFSNWWDEFRRSGSGRDQLSLPYVLWKHGISFEDVAVMGRNAYADTKLYIADHG